MARVAELCLALRSRGRRWCLDQARLEDEDASNDPATSQIVESFVCLFKRTCVCSQMIHVDDSFEIEINDRADLMRTSEIRSAVAG